MQVSDYIKNPQADNDKKSEDRVFSNFVTKVECHGGFME